MTAPAPTAELLAVINNKLNFYGARFRSGDIEGVAWNIAQDLIGYGLVRQAAAVSQPEVQSGDTPPSEVQVSYDLAREDGDLTTVTVCRVFENGFKVLLQLQGEDAIAFIDAWNARGGDVLIKPTAWRVWWVSLNNARTELFEDIDKATAKAHESGGCVIPLYTAPQPLSAAQAPSQATLEPDQYQGTCEDRRLISAGYKVCGSGADTQWHWHGPDGKWHDGYRSENAAVNAALRDLASSMPSADGGPAA